MAVFGGVSRPYALSSLRRDAEIAMLRHRQTADYKMGCHVTHQNLHSAPQGPFKTDVPVVSRKLQAPVLRMGTTSQICQRPPNPLPADKG
jgi:hypothetical protein